MSTIIEGTLATPSGRFAIIAARFNETVVSALTDGAIDAFKRHGVSEDRIDRYRVPGAFEIPLVARRIAKRYAAVVCLGCIIRGETDHYDHVAGAATSGLVQASNETGVPVIFGVLTTETLEQAIHRAGGKAGNKGYEAAVTAIEMANLMAAIGPSSTTG
jgi:6,7-dimethyl-8-ribityllumazine synthase